MKKILVAAIALLMVLPVFAQEQSGKTDDTSREAAPVPLAAPTAADIGNVKPAGNTISLNLKGMDIVDVLKMFAPYGMNIVVGKNVSGKVTLFLKNVGVWDAFEIILLANDLAYEKKADIIYVMAQRDYEAKYGQRSDEQKHAKLLQLQYAKAADVAVALGQIKSNIGRIVVDAGSNTLALIDTPERISDMEEFIRKTDLPLKTVVFNLNFAQADKLQAKIQDILTKNVGTLRIDERTNKIAVTDYPEKVEEITTIVNAFDEKTMQVLIDAQILEISPSKAYNMGVDWDFWLKKNVRLLASMPTSGAVNKLSIGAAATSLTKSPTDPGQYKGIIDLLQTIGDLKILSSPRIMAVNNQEARILVGTKQPYAQSTTVTGDGGVVTTSETVNYVDVGIKLYVTPTINRAGFIMMKIKPEVSSAGTPLVTAKGEQIPVVSTSEAETSVMVKDGITIIIGGLTKHQTENTISQIPVLGSIPILGNLFKRTARSNTKTELVILLTPHIMSGEAAVTDFSQVRARDGVRMRIRGDDVYAERMTAASEEKRSAGSPEEYYKLVLDKVKSAAVFNSPLTEKGAVTVIFNLSSKGVLIGEPVIEHSSNARLNPLAVKAIKTAAPFPPFPGSFPKDKTTFRVELLF